MAITDTWLHGEVAANRVLPVKFAGQLFLLDARGVLYCPQRDALVVSDLHLEKGSFLSRFANPLPQLDTRSTLLGLQCIIADYSPRQVICLGDSFHDADGFYRMSEEEQRLLSVLVSQCEKWMWVLGNHDPAIPEQAGGHSALHLEWDDMVLSHEPEAGNAFQLVGHYHPKVRKTVSRKRFSGKCFVHNARVFVMPAFGQYTGGLDIETEPMRALFEGKAMETFLLFEGGIYKV